MEWRIKKQAGGPLDSRRPYTRFGRNSHRCANRIMRLPLKPDTDGAGTPDSGYAVAFRRKRPFSALPGWFPGCSIVRLFTPARAGKMNR